LCGGTVGWYNGDFDNNNGLANEQNTTVSQANVYDDFVVPAGGWTVVGVFSNDLISFTGITQAFWEIRSGVSVGNGGALIDSGTSDATQTATGRSGFGFTEYTIEVDGLNIVLAPGTYWLTVSPIGFGSGRSFVSETLGANAIGTPPGNNGNGFFNSSSFNVTFGDAADQTSGRPDFSQGVLINGGGSVPEPGTAGLLLGSATLLWFVRRLRQSR
jgi:hypothetical protein